MDDDIPRSDLVGIGQKPSDEMMDVDIKCAYLVI
jgi:hypothetical protein